MKFLYCLVVLITILPVSALGCSEFSVVQDSIGDKKDITFESEQKLLRFKLKTAPMLNTAYPETYLIPDNLIIDKLMFPDPVVLNILDEYFLNKLKKKNKGPHEEMIFSLDKSGREEMLQSLRLSFREDPEAVAVIRKYLGASRKTAAVILLIIHLTAF
ncbi:MAG: hypothetical protein ACM3Q2_10810 [Syntrophothermus sp.]